MRRGLCIGAGGALGYAWSVSALRRLEEQTGWDARTAPILIGTSAGAVIASLLAAGTRVADLPRAAPADRHLPPAPRGRPSSLRLLAGSLAGKQPPLVGLCGLLPAGRAPRLRLAELVPAGPWPAHPGLRVVVMDADSGARVAFGAPDAPPAPIHDAVAASCAIPGWVAPLAIGGRRYVDGGAVSPTSLDLAAAERLDEVVVVSPMTSARFAFPGSLAQLAERLMRTAMSRVLAREVAMLEAAGTLVVRLEPTAHDLRLMGANFMDGRRSAQVIATWDA